MKDKILLAVAPVDASDTIYDYNSVSKEVIACAEAGAGMVHLHVRNKKGVLTSDLTELDKTLSVIRANTDMVIEVSTGGVSNLTIQERCAPLYDKLVEYCSLNVGSVNLGDYVYCNPIKDVKFCVKEIKETGKIPEVEVFEIGMIDTMIKLQKEFRLPKNLLYAVVLGHIGAAPATVKALDAMISFIPKDSYWGITHAHRNNDDIILAALDRGASTVRIGFEDSHIVKDGIIAKNNIEIVEHYANLISSRGFDLMTSAEARRKFGYAE